jgi:hypothetical protein
MCTKSFEKNFKKLVAYAPKIQMWPKNLNIFQKKFQILKINFQKFAKKFSKIRVLSPVFKMWEKIIEIIF